MIDKYRLIGLIYKLFAKPLFFLFDPEFVHDRIITLGHFLGRFEPTRQITRKIFNFSHTSLEQNLSGLKLRNPIGLSAGFDKNAELINIMPNVGFSFMEIGSATYKPYEGNPKPRLYRLKKSKGLVVYYGLKNIGIHKIAQRMNSAIKQDSIVGLSIAKTNCKETSTIEGGIDDYVSCLKVAESESIADYYTINISCPNTFGGEPFTTADKLEKLLVAFFNQEVSRPVFIKMPVDLSSEEFDELLKVTVNFPIAGVIIGNLTKNRDSDLIKDHIPENVKGGISGIPTQKLCNDLIAYTYKNYGDKLKIIGVGGIFTAQDAYQKIKLGASALQLITGMIFNGPQLIGQINKELVGLLNEDGYMSISDAVGKSVG